MTPLRPPQRGIAPEAFQRFILERLSEPILPQVWPPLGSFFRDERNVFTIPANTLVYVPALTFQVQTGRREVVGFLGMDVNSAVALAFVQFRFTVDGSPAENYQNWQPVGTTDNPTFVHQPLYSGATFALEFTNTDPATAYTVTTRLGHWAWDPALILAELAR